MTTEPEEGVIECVIPRNKKKLIQDYAEAVKKAAHTIGVDIHGMNEREFEASGLFQAAIERIRGQQSAKTTEKYEWAKDILRLMKEKRKIKDFDYTGMGERHDFVITMQDDTRVVIETKGCLDGNNTNIFIRPPDADEFYIWSLCQNSGADQRHNVWSGIHTRLGAEIVATRVPVNGLIVWDKMCGTKGRPCPKGRVGHDYGDIKLPPPCMYSFPRTIPDARNNKNPPLGRLQDLKFFRALYETFNCSDDDFYQVGLEVKHDKENTVRRTSIIKRGKTIKESEWNEVKRAKA